ncbi:glycosyltransferase family 4 protein [Paremcibacter congregatus]|uniref:glycosyltransferase family 4 protein n=1 Tax=Paremcibacter congregatus TaxID=2043170 RepID=UPI003A8FE612
MKVALLTNIVPPYRFNAYEALHIHAKAAGGGLTIVCTNHSEPQRNWPKRNAQFAQQTLRGIHLRLGENRLFSLPIGTLSTLNSIKPDSLILAGFGIAHWQAQNWALKQAIPTILQFDGWSGSDKFYLNPARRYVRHSMVAKADGFIAAGSRGKKWFEKYGTDPGTTLTAPIPTSFQSSPFTPKRSFSDRRYDVLWCGRTTQAKGFDPFLEIAARLAKAGTIDKIGIVGSTDIPATAQALNEYGLTGITDIHGQLPPEQLPTFLGDAKLCLFPSHNDAYGVGVVEAISCGAVALASTAVGCAPDLLERNEILPTGNTMDWVAACTRLLESPDAWDRARQAQASKIRFNTPQHHADIMWQAVTQATTPSKAARRWN